MSMVNNVVKSEHAFPVLYGKASTGKVKEWHILVLNKNGVPTTQIFNGYTDGKKALSERETPKGKNIGKKNETTPWEQAISEAERKWINKKEKEGYLEQLDSLDDQVIVLPMLAQKFELKSTTKKKKDIVFPCAIQPKLDGLRCMAYLNPDNTVTLMTRVGKKFNHLDHIRDAVKHLLHGVKNGNVYLDGELYTDKIPFEEITGLCRREKIKPSDQEKLTIIEYHIFDVYCIDNKEYPFRERNKFIKSLFNKSKSKSPPSTYLKYVDTKNCDKVELVKLFHDTYVQEGYEGIMLRNWDSAYAVKNRTRDLQKYKEFLDDEYKIVGYSEASGEDHGTIIWKCQYKNKHGESAIFSVRPRGSREKRTKFYDECCSNFSKYNGKLLTVRFQELSQDECPRFPVGIDIRFDI
jgi:ATP-dependent DNA ligase